MYNVALTNWFIYTLFLYNCKSINVVEDAKLYPPTKYTRNCYNSIQLDLANQLIGHAVLQQLISKAMLQCTTRKSKCKVQTLILTYQPYHILCMPFYTGPSSNQHWTHTLPSLPTTHRQGHP